MTDYTYRLRPEDGVGLPKIPVHPVGYHDAVHLLKYILSLLIYNTYSVIIKLFHTDLFNTYVSCRRLACKHSVVCMRVSLSTTVYKQFSFREIVNHKEIIAIHSIWARDFNLQSYMFLTIKCLGSDLLLRFLTFLLNYTECKLFFHLSGTWEGRFHLTTGKELLMCLIESVQDSLTISKASK